MLISRAWATCAQTPQFVSNMGQHAFQHSNTVLKALTNSENSILRPNFEKKMYHISTSHSNLLGE